MIDIATFKPNTVYVTYIAATPERVWQALTSAGRHPVRRPVRLAGDPVQPQEPAGDR